MIYQSPDFNGVTVEIKEILSSFIPHFIGHVITYTRCDRI